MKLSFFILSFLAILIMGGCQKQQLKKPTKASFIFNSNKNETQQDIIHIKQVDYHINEFEIIGFRKKGADIDFVRDINLAIDFNDQSVVPSLNFDIPQGDYSQLFFNAKSSLSSDYNLSVKGQYKLTQGPTVDVIFEIKKDLAFSFLLNEIELSKKTPTTFELFYDIKSWFSNLTANDLDNATLITYNNSLGLGNSTILINDSNNLNLYNNVLDHMFLSNKAIVK
jgi:hypothetical protein